MILVWSKHQRGQGCGVLSYLLDATVVKTASGRKVQICRNPLPEILFGNPDLVRGFIDVLAFRCRYRCVTLSYAAEDIDVPAFNAGDIKLRAKVNEAVRLFLELAFAGVPPRGRPPLLGSTHTHLGRLEVNILLPRAVGVPGSQLRSWNPHPPTAASKSDWDAWTDVVNNEFGWSDPRCPLRRQAITPPSWMVKETAELMRRATSEHPARVDPADPRFRAWSLARAAIRNGPVHRDTIRDQVAHGLAPFQWGITSESVDGITCGPLHEPGQRVTFRGAALGDGAEGATDPFDAMVARQEEIALAPERVRDAMIRRAEANKALLRASTLAQPYTTGLSPRRRKMASLTTRLQAFIMQFEARLWAVVDNFTATRRLRLLNLHRVQMIADTLEKIDAHFIHQHHRTAHGAPDRIARDTFGTREFVSSGGASGPVSGRARTYRGIDGTGGADHARNRPTLGQHSHEIGRRGLGRPHFTADRNSHLGAEGYEGSGLTPDRDPGPASTSRADWLNAVRVMVAEICGAPKPVAFESNADGSESLVVQNGTARIILPIYGVFLDAAWLQHAREIISAAVYPDHDRLWEKSIDGSDNDLDLEP